MIRTDRLSLDTGTFAAERRGVMNDAMARLEEPVRYSTMRLGLPRWAEHIVVAALDIFDTTARAEVDEWSQILDDMRDNFEVELRRALDETKSSSDPARQRETLARWVSTMAVNAATEAATTADPDDGVGLEWVTMGDPDVRHSHQETAGQTVPTGHAFTVGDVELLYPGQPVGDPANWINCRCTVRPTMLTRATSNTITASGDNAVENTSSVIVALPVESDPVQALGPEQSHVTLVWLGEAASFDPQPLKDELAAYAQTFSGEPLPDSVSGTALLGKDMADVLLLDARHLANIRDGLLMSGVVKDLHDAAEQFPTWIPHLTLGYASDPDYVPTTSRPESITFDRIALWHGDEQTEYPLGGTVAVEDSTEQASVMRVDKLTVDGGVKVEKLSVAKVLGDDDPMAPEIEGEDTPDGPPMLDDDEADLPVPWHGVLAPEGVPSGDGRQFAHEALTNRKLPLPLKYMPADAAGHDGSVVCGRIDKIWREDGEIRAEGVFDHSEWGYEAIRQIAEQMLRGVSVDVDAVEASVDPEVEAAGLMEFSKARIAAATLCAIPAFAEAWVALGPWQDIKEEDVETEDAAEYTAEAGVFTATAVFAPDLEKAYPCNYCSEPATKYIHHSEGMAYVTACAEHFEQAKTDAAGSVPGGEPDPSNIDRIYDLAGTTAQFKRVPQKTKDGPGWITAPKPTHRITDYWVDGTGAAKIGWGAPGDFNRCRTQLAKYVQNPQWLAGLCANLHYRALGAWPGQANGATEELEGKSLTASVSFAPADQIIVPVEAFVNPMLEEETPFTITEDGRVFGHLATWNVCHIGIGDACVNAPPSLNDYAYFLTGKVLTDAGPVAVGQVSLGGGHAAGRYGVRAAIAHYDSTSTAVADITVGEDEIGVWCAGVLRPGTTAEQVYALRAAVLSGDWREVIVNGEANLELVAALAVNVPGYPIPRPTLVASAAGQTALFGASIARGNRSAVDSKANAELTQAMAVVRNFNNEARNQAVRHALKVIANGKAV